jgi:hypothetical protein
MGSRFEQQEMLVENIEIMKGPNDRIKSLVRLYLRNHKTKEIFASGIYFNPMKGNFEVLPRITHGEVGPTRQFVGEKSTDCAVPCEIQRGVQVVDNVADHQGQVQKVIFKIWDFVCEELSRSFTISLGCRDVTIFQRRNGCLQLRNVLVGPLDLEAGIPKNCAHSKEVITFG